MKPENIFLTGFMCSGKTSAGKILARLTGRRFSDSDAEIRKALGASPARLIKEKGEAFFREEERKVVRSLGRKKNQVIALGGGVSLSGPEWKTVRKKSVVVYMDCPEEELSRRLLKSRKSRPLTGTGDKKAVRARVRELMRARLAGYHTADWIMMTWKMTPAGIASFIKEKMERNG
ncbi:MAG: shikimate kinase [bacterium]